METKENFKNWLASDNRQIRLYALRYQWIKLAKKQDPLFFLSELISYPDAPEAFSMALELRPEILPTVVELLAEAEKISVEYFARLVYFSTQQEKYIPDIKKVVTAQKFFGTDLNNIIYTILCSVDRTPEWLETGLVFVDKVEPNVNYCVMLSQFLSKWGRFDEASNEMVTAAFEKILPEWAPLLTSALTTVSGRYRFDLSLSLFKKYYSLEEMKAIVECFHSDESAELKQFLLNGMFNYLNAMPKEQIGDEAARVFVENIAPFLIAHWEDNCFKFFRFWEKFNYCPSFFQSVRRAFGSDEKLAQFNTPSKDPLVNLKSPLHMLCYLPLMQDLDLCMLLLNIYAYGNKENQNLVAKIWMKNESGLCCAGSFEKVKNELQQLLDYAKSHEMTSFVSNLLNSLILNGEEVEDVEALSHFIKDNDLRVYALQEVYGRKLDEINANFRKEGEILRFLSNV